MSAMQEEKLLTLYLNKNTTTIFTTEACEEFFKIQSGLLNCNSEKVLYILNWKMCGEVPYVGKAKNKF